MNFFKKRKIPGVMGSMEIEELRALLKTMGEDDHLIIHELQITNQNNGKWRVLARNSRKKDAAK